MQKVLFWFSGAEDKLINHFPTDQRKYYVIGLCSILNAVFVASIAVESYLLFFKNTWYSIILGLLFATGLTLANHFLLSTFRKRHKAIKNIFSVQFIISALVAVCCGLVMSVSLSIVLFRDAIVHKMEDKKIVLVLLSDVSSSVDSLPLKPNLRRSNSIVYTYSDKVDTLKGFFNDSSIQVSNASHISSFFHSVDSMLTSRRFKPIRAHDVSFYLEGYSKLQSEDSYVLTTNILLFFLISLIIGLPVFLMALTPFSPYDEALLLAEEKRFNYATKSLIDEEDNSEIQNFSGSIFDRVRYRISKNKIIGAINDLFYIIEEVGLTEERIILIHITSQIKNLRNQIAHNTIDIEYGNKELSRLVAKLLDMCARIESKGKHESTNIDKPLSQPI